MSTVESQELRSAVADWRAAIRLQRPNLCLGSLKDHRWNLCVPQKENESLVNWLLTLPFLWTRDLDLSGFRIIPAHIMNILLTHKYPPAAGHFRSGCPCILGDIGVCWVPDLDKGPWHSAAVDFTSIVKKSPKNIQEPREDAATWCFLTPSLQ